MTGEASFACARSNVICGAALGFDTTRVQLVADSDCAGNSGAVIAALKNDQHAVRYL